MITIDRDQVDQDQPPTTIEICFWCGGDAATSCCLARVRWYRLHGHAAPAGVHCPQEHHRCR